MGIFIDYESDNFEIKKILLSDNKWYEVKEKTYCVKDAFEIGTYDSDSQQFIFLTDMGIGFECVLKNGDVLKVKLSEIKAFITK
tara:strand:- start:3918 stop:4169 length:252 start_codon:yes stop_codon:yes gene_type:complete